MSAGMGSGSRRRLKRMRGRMVGSFGAGRRIGSAGGMIGGGLIKVSSSSRESANYGGW